MTIADMQHHFDETHHVRFAQDSWDDCWICLECTEIAVGQRSAGWVETWLS